MRRPSESDTAPAREPDVTDLLRAWQAGDADAGERLLAALYRELHLAAHRQMARERRGGTLDTTALVNEAYLRLVDQSRIRWQDRNHFLALAATVMRRVLIDRARRRNARKRANAVVPVSLAEIAEISEAAPEPLDLLEVDQALQRLSAAFERPGRVVELRFFGGFEMQEIASILGVTARTVERDWTFARAWLLTELSPTREQ